MMIHRPYKHIKYGPVQNESSDYESDVSSKDYYDQLNSGSISHIDGDNKASRSNTHTEPDGGETRQKKLGLMEAWRQWPKGVFCIVGNEFCERFNFYGMRAVLFLYLVKLGFDDDGATAMYHGFTVLAYFSPLIGAFIADGYVGKYNVILWVSLLYASGSVMLAIASVITAGAVHPWFDLVGLFVIGIGTGGIKPCVAPFGADQFKRGQEGLIEPYFSFFYFAINAGSVLSIIISPIFRVTRCLGQPTCYPLAFGVPAVLMVLAVASFVLGSLFGYRKIPPKENIIAEVCKAIVTAIRNRFNFTIKRSHWLDHYLDNHSCKYDPRCTDEKCHKEQFIDDVKGMLRVLIMYIPMPVFWALFDQQGSRWLIQSTEMSYNIGGWTMPPALIQAINPIFIMLFIPLFQSIIYPGLKYIGLNPTPLRRMVVGGFVSAAAFVVAALVQFNINGSLPVMPDVGKGHLNFVNTLECNLTLANTDLKLTYTVPSNGTIDDLPAVKGFPELHETYIQNLKAGSYDWTVSSPDCAKDFPQKITTKIEDGKMAFAVIRSTAEDSKTLEGSLAKDGNGLGLFDVSINDYRYTNYTDTKYYSIFMCADGDPNMETAEKICNPRDSYNFQEFNMTVETKTSKFIAILPRKVWHLFEYTGTKSINDETPEFAMANVKDMGISFYVGGQGGIYTLTAYNETGTMTTTHQMYQIVNDNVISILWQVPQFAIITAAEILISITGLEFSYSQAAQSMKSVLQAAWLLTVSFGDIIIIIIAEVKFFPNLAEELLFFAGLMVVVTLIFMLMSIFYYEYRYYDQVIEDDDDNNVSLSKMELNDE